MPDLLPFDVIDLRPPGAVAWAPNTPAGTWASTPVPFFLRAFPTAGAESELEVALRTWNTVACTAFRGVYAGTSNLDAADDGVNVIVYHADAWPAELEPGVVAQTVVFLDAGGKIHDADIHLNGKDHRYSLDGAPGTVDLRSVLVHEIGHALGLGHSGDPRATMFVSGSGVRWRSLETDDREGVCALYPGLGAPGCSVNPCPANYVCVGDACQARREPGNLCSPCERRADCEGAGDSARCVDGSCGRACTVDAQCGTGFACRPTTESGDLQCVSLEECRNGASPCTTDADCGGATCVLGACVGPRAAKSDGGAPSDAGPSALIIAGGGQDGCDCRGTPARPTGLFPGLLAVLVFALMWRRLRR